MALLKGSKLKLSRAEQHLNTLTASIQEFVESNPYSLILHPDPYPPQYMLQAKINNTISTEYGCIIGDFAHNVRSSLDLLVYQLSDLIAGDKARFKLQFPIFDHDADYHKYEKVYLNGVQYKYKKIIEKYQPYKQKGGFDDNPLKLLRHINDADKHRIIPVVGAIATLNYFIFDGSSGSPDFLKFEKGSSLRVAKGFNFGNGFTGTKINNGAITKDGAIVAKFTIPQAEKIKINPEMQFTIQFQESDPYVQGRSVIDTLMLIYSQVKEIIEEFEK